MQNMSGPVDSKWLCHPTARGVWIMLRASCAREKLAKFSAIIYYTRVECSVYAPGAKYTLGWARMRSGDGDANPKPRVKLCMYFVRMRGSCLKYLGHAITRL